MLRHNTNSRPRCAAADAVDLAAARGAVQRRRELEGNRDQLSATLAGLCGDDDIAQLRSRLAELGAAQLAEPDLLALDVTGARAELDAAEASQAAEAPSARRAASSRRPPAAGLPRHPRGRRFS